MSEPAPPRRSHRRRRTTGTLVVLGALVLRRRPCTSGCRSRTGPDQESRSPAHPSPTPLSSVDLSGLPIARSSPCDRIDRGRHRDRARRSGRRRRDLPTRRPGEPGPGAARRLARVRLHLPRWGRRRGAGLALRPAREPRRGVGHRARGHAREGLPAARGGPAFGRPTATTSCATTRLAGRSVTLRGLFGDAWLSCQLTLPADGAGGAADAGPGAAVVRGGVDRRRLGD